MAGRIVMLLVALEAAACTRHGLEQGDAATGCSWEPALNQADAAVGTGYCYAGRAFVSCSLSNGNWMDCMSDSTTECTAQNPDPSTVVVSCESRCAEDEFAVLCRGNPIGSAAPQPPTGCQHVAIDPGGGISYCCACR